MQLNNTTNLLKDSSEKQKIRIANDYLQKLQRYFTLATVLIPFLGSVLAIGLLWRWGIDTVDLGLLVSMYVLTFAGIEIGFHRHFSHRAFQASLFVRVILAILGSMAAQGPVIHWVSNHRRHHQYSDKLGDPHSPQVFEGKKFGLLGRLWHSHIGWLFDSELTNSIFYAKDLLRGSAITKVNQMYLIWVILGLFIPAVLGGVLTWTWIGILKGFLWGGLVRIFLVHQVTWATNSIVHVYGKRPFDTNDYSTNNIWLAVPTFGGSWHNNHHAFSSSAITGLEWWQIDLGGWFIRVLKFAGLVWDIKRPTVETIQAKRININNKKDITNQ